MHIGASNLTIPLWSKWEQPISAYVQPSMTSRENDRIFRKPHLEGPKSYSMAKNTNPPSRLTDNLSLKLRLLSIYSSSSLLCILYWLLRKNGRHLIQYRTSISDPLTVSFTSDATQLKEAKTRFKFLPNFPLIKAVCIIQSWFLFLLFFTYSLKYSLFHEICNRTSIISIWIDR